MRAGVGGATGLAVRVDAGTADDVAAECDDREVSTGGVKGSLVTSGKLEGSALPLGFWNSMDLMKTT
jgi:hypothetical protein